MHHALKLLAFLVLATTLQAEEQPLLAEVIDSDSRRVVVLVVAPKYPAVARRDRVEGEVQVCFDIDRRGHPRRIAVRHSSNRAFERPSIKAVRASTFLPLAAGETLQAPKMCRTFIFSLVPRED